MRSRISLLLLSIAIGVGLAAVPRMIWPELEILASWIQRGVIDKAFPSATFSPDVLIDCDDQYQYVEREGVQADLDHELDRVRADAFARSPRIVVIGNWRAQVTPRLFADADFDTVVIAARMDHPLAPSSTDLDAHALIIPADPRIPEISTISADARLLRGARRWGASAYAIDTALALDSFRGLIPTVVRHNGKVFPSVFLQTPAAWEGVAVSSAVIHLGDDVRIGKLRFPIDERGYFTITRIRFPPYAGAIQSLVRYLEDSPGIRPPDGTRVYSFNYRRDRWLPGPVPYNSIDGWSLDLWDPVGLTAVAVENVLHGEAVRRWDGWRVVEIVGDLMDEISGGIFKRKATLDKFVMGSLFVVLNDPIEIPGHERLSIDLARSLLFRVRRFLERRPETRALTASIGIETGDAVVGNLGSKDYVTYTAIGETVNLAARLSTWASPWEIALGPTTASRVGETSGRAETATLKGVAVPVPVVVLPMRPAG